MFMDQRDITANSVTEPLKPKRPFKMSDIIWNFHYEKNSRDNNIKLSMIVCHIKAAMATAYKKNWF